MAAIEFDFWRRAASAHWLAPASLVGAIVFLALVLARSVHVVLSPLPSLPPLPVTPPVPSVVAPSNVPIAGFRLFGQVGVPIELGGVPNAPDTQLKLRLTGIAAGLTPQQGYALIADERGVEQRYRPGQDVAGAILDAVYADRVTLRVGGRLETLRLARNEATVARLDPVSPASAGAADGPSAGAAADPSGGFVVGAAGMQSAAIAAVREQALAHPAAFAASVSVVPVTANGRLLGVRLSAPQHADLLLAAGLLPDDLVTQVNGVRIDSIEQGLRILDTLRSADQVTVTVRRGEAEVLLPPIRLK